MSSHSASASAATESASVDLQAQLSAVAAERDQYARKAAERDHYARKTEVLARQVETLRSQLEWFKQQVFGETSERMLTVDPARQAQLFGGLPDAHQPDAAEPPKPPPATPSRPRRKKRPPGTGESGLRADATVPRRIVDERPEELDGEDKDDYEIIDYRVTERLARTRGTHFIVEYRRPVIKHRPSGRLRTPPAPPAVFDRSIADVTFLAGMILDKCQWHLPLHRQHQRLQAEGIHLSRTTLSDLMRRAAQLLTPIAAAQLAHVITSRVLALDETTMKAGRGRPGKMKRGYYWVAYGEDDEAVFTFSNSRGGVVVEDLLKDFRGTLLTDGYTVYDDYAAARPTITHAQCWAHARRKFDEAKKAEPKASTDALTLIGGIYHQESAIRDAGVVGAEKRERRRTFVAPYVEKFWDWVDRQLRRPDLEPKSRLARALNYARTRKDALEVFLDDPAVQLDTNHVERVLRPVPMGRKNHLFCWTETGAKELGVLHSLVATCRLQAVDPFMYLVDVLHRVDAHPSSAVVELTPRVWKQRLAQDPIRPAWWAGGPDEITP